MRQVDKKEYF